MKKYLIIATLLVGGGALFYNKVYKPKHTFLTQQATQGSIDIAVSGIGNVGAKDIYKIGSVFGGKVLDFDVDEGEFIKKGKVVAHIDSIDLEAKIAELDATLKKIQSDTKSLEVDKKSAKIYAEYQNDIYQKNKNLYAKRAISELDLKKFETNYETAQLKVTSLQSKINSLNAQKKQTQESRYGLKERLQRYTIIAPIDGYVMKKYVTNYTIINPNQPLIELVNPKDVWVEAHIDTRKSGAVKMGDSVDIVLRSSSKVYKGKVAMINPINNSVTNEREIDVSFENLPLPFYLEEQASVEIAIKHLNNIVKISSKALSFYNKQEGVWLVQADDTIHFKPLKVIAKDGTSVAVNGLTGNEVLAIEDPKKKSFQEGMKIYHD
jgi:HlyD family secretion protein